MTPEPSLRHRLVPLFERALRAIDDRSQRFIQPRRLRGKLNILSYCGWGTPCSVELSGRVVLPRTLRPPDNADPRWRNLANSLRRLFSREVSGVTVTGNLNGMSAEAVSDSDGFFTLHFRERRGQPGQEGGQQGRPQERSAGPPDGSERRDAARPGWPLCGGWHSAELRLRGRDKLSHGWVQVVDQGAAQYGVISDLDDTVIRSDVTSLPRMLFTVLTGNARTRSPFPGVGSLYRALSGGQGTRNPVFYVSSSPWNFFDLLWQFLDYRRIPMGPLFLRNWGAELFQGHGGHKHAVIERILATYPALRFVLVGDSGEHDAEIYAEVATRHPGRVLGIYIRDVSGADARTERVLRLRADLQRLGVDLVLASDSFAAAAHAMAMGLIPPEGVRAVAQSVERNQLLPF